MTAADQDLFHVTLQNALPDRVPAPTAAQLGVMFAYYSAVVEANRRFNLTRIVDPAEAAVKHFADALAPLGWMKANGVEVSSLLDVGTGAGFPAVPLAIMRPRWQVTAIDSTAKKVRFVAETSARLGLTNLSAEHHRAGEWRPPRRFDLVLFKAVGDMRECVERSRHLVNRGGHVVAYKTAAVSAREQEASLLATRRTRLDTLEPYAYRLRGLDETLERVLWVFRKL